ncbi:MAG: TIM barrel protein [Candidatus Lokiarchaeota archaeon]|nr:TIM barrel protein [Candidatus Lokiarchaeota archaeon]
MTKFAVSAITDEFSKDLNKVCSYLAEQDVEYVELRHVIDGNILTVEDDIIEQAKDILKDNGLKVSCIAGGNLKCIPPSVDPEPTDKKSTSRNWRYNFSLIDRAFDLAEKLDAPYIRCFAFSGRWDVKPIKEWDNWQIFQEWKKIVEKTIAKAIKRGKMVICENDAGFNKSLHQVQEIGKRFAGEGFGMLFDMANTVNKYRGDGILTDEWLNKIGQYFQYIHAKGSKKFLWFRGTTYVNGKHDITRWPQVLDYLSEMNPDDFVQPAPNPLFLSIETHMGGKKKKWARSARSLRNLQELVENY